MPNWLSHGTPGRSGPVPGKSYTGMSSKRVRSKTESGRRVKGTCTRALDGPNAICTAGESDYYGIDLKTGDRIQMGETVLIFLERAVVQMLGT